MWLARIYVTEWFLCNWKWPDIVAFALFIYNQKQKCWLSSSKLKARCWQIKQEWKLRRRQVIRFKLLSKLRKKEVDCFLPEKIPRKKSFFCFNWKEKHWHITWTCFCVSEKWLNHLTLQTRAILGISSFPKNSYSTDTSVKK